MLYSGGKSAGGVCLFFGPDGGVWLEFCCCWGWPDGALAKRGRSLVRRGHTVVCVNSSGHWASLLAHWPDCFCVSVSLNTVCVSVP